MQHYCGERRSEDMLMQGLSHVRNLYASVLKTLQSRNPHEMMYCISVINLYQFAELMFLMSLDRKESRGYFQRIDYPLQNLIFDGKRHIIRCDGTTNFIYWR